MGFHRRSVLATLLLGSLVPVVVPSMPRADIPVLEDGDEFQVSEDTTSFHGTPAISSAADGTFVVVWIAEDGSLSGIRARRFDAAAEPIDSEFPVNTHTTAYQQNPDVASAPDGSFVVVWHRATFSQSDRSVHGQRFDAAGVAAGTEFLANTYTTSRQFDPTVSIAADGSFVVVWTSEGQDGSGTGVHGQRFDASGAPAGSEFQVNTHTTAYQQNPDVASAPDGRFIVTWSSRGADGSGDGVRGQRFDTAGNPDGGEFQVNAYTTGYQSGPAIAALADASFVVAWNSYAQDDIPLSVRGQRFDAMGAPVGSEFLVNANTSSWQFAPAVALSADGSFEVAWTSRDQDGGEDAIVGRRFDASGLPVATEFQVNTDTASAKSSAAIAAVGAAGFMVVWESADGQFGNRPSVHGQGFCTDTSCTLCGAAPVGGCLSAGAAARILDSSDDKQDTLRWKWSRGERALQSDLGAPATSTTYTLCMYDSIGGVDSLVGALKIDPNANWNDEAPDGWRYLDAGGAEDGVGKLQLRIAPSGRSLVQVIAKGTNLPLPPAVSATELFALDSTVTFQLLNDATSTCWTSQFTTARRNQPDRFIARTP